MTYDDDKNIETSDEENGTEQENVFADVLKKKAKKGGVSVNPPQQSAESPL